MTSTVLPDLPDWIKYLKFNEQGLMPAIAQDYQTNTILMVAWMNAQALQLTLEKKQAVYYSRSRQKLWHKGEESGHFQTVHAIKTDCDGDVIILSIQQHGGIACHTGRESCFFYELSDTKQWNVIDPILKNPELIYNTPHTC